MMAKALLKTIYIDRIIKKIEGKKEGPTVVFFGGIHGNETAGVFAALALGLNGIATAILVPLLFKLLNIF